MLKLDDLTAGSVFNNDPPVGASYQRNTPTFAIGSVERFMVAAPQLEAEFVVNDSVVPDADLIALTVVLLEGQAPPLSTST